MRGNLRKFVVAFLVFVAIVVVAYLSRHRIHLADFTWKKFKGSLAQANIWLVLASLVAIYGCYAIRALRWQRFSRSLGSSRFLDVFGGTIMGFAAIFVLGRPGEPVRPLLLARKSRSPVASMFGIWVLERMFDFAAGIALATLSAWVFASDLAKAGVDEDSVERFRAAGPLLLGIFLGLTGVMLYFRLHGAGALDRRLKKWHGERGWRGGVATAVDGFSQGLQAIRSFSDLVLAVAYTAAHWGLVALVYLMVCRAFSATFPDTMMNFTGAMLLLAVTLVGSVLQLPGVGGGAQVASIVALTTIFQLDQEPALAIAMVLWAITFASPALVGIPLLIHEGLSLGELRHLAQAEAKAEEAGEHLSLTGMNWRPPRAESKPGDSAS